MEKKFQKQIPTQIMQNQSTAIRDTVFFAVGILLGYLTLGLF